jgi:hypothetical protein
MAVLAAREHALDALADEQLGAGWVEHDSRAANRPFEQAAGRLFGADKRDEPLAPLAVE